MSGKRLELCCEVGVEIGLVGFLFLGKQVPTEVRVEEAEQDWGGLGQRVGIYFYTFFFVTGLYNLLAVEFFFVHACEWK